MKKVVVFGASLLILSTSPAFAISEACIALYKNGKVEAINGKAGGAKKVALTPEDIKRRKVEDDVLMPMFVRAFEIEFGIKMEPGHQEIYKKLLFRSEELTAVEKDLMEDGIIGDGQTVNPDGSPIKSFLNWNHLINKNQEQAAEKVLRELRNDPKLELTQMQLVALRVSRLIERDYDLFTATEFEGAAMKEVDARRRKFLDLFDFGGGGAGQRRDQQVKSGEGYGNVPKKLTDKEYKALVESYAAKDDPMAEGRFDIEQSYDAKYITKEMIQAANERKIKAGSEWINPKALDQAKEIASDKILSEAKKRLDRRMNEKDFSDSVEWVRRLSDRVLAKGKNFETFGEFKTWLTGEHTRLSEILETLKIKEVKKYAEVFLEGMDKDSQFIGYVKKLKNKIERNEDMDPSYKADVIKFLDSPIAKSMFILAKEEIHISGKIKYSGLLELVETRSKYLETIVQVGHRDPAMLSVIYRTKMILYGASEVEAQKIFDIVKTNDVTRLGKLAYRDPKSQFGFCFGRAFVHELVALKYGIDPSSTRKIYVYGKMSGGLFGWQWHVAHLIAKEGGGFWVLDTSHGKPETLEEWMSKYKKATKDGKIRMFIAPADRFGRSGFEIPDQQVLFNNYYSFWDKVAGALGIDSKNSYFKDAIDDLGKTSFAGERKGFFEGLYDKIQDLTFGL